MRFEQHRSAANGHRTRKIARRCRFWCRLTAIVVAISGTAPEISAQNTRLPSVTDVVLGSESFQIPFNIDTGGVQPREVHLYMAVGSQTGASARSGASQGGETPKWKLLDRQPPGSGHFPVTQTGDGVFWFATRTIDTSGRPHPPGPIEPELKVTVDTTEPDVDLMAESDAEGKVTASFSVVDATETPQITAHYVTDSLRQWNSISVTRTADGGEFQFTPTDQWHLLSIRLRVLDAAGNETIVKERVRKPRVATAGSARLASSPMNFGNPLAPGTSAAPGNSATMGNSPAAPPIYSGALSPRHAMDSANVAGNSSALPPPSTADQISQDFGRTETPLHQLPDARTSNTELLPAPEPTRDSQSQHTHQSKRKSESESKNSPQTPAEAMRPLSPQAAPEKIPAPSGNPAPSDNPAPPGNRVSGEEEPAPETPFAAESIPAPRGQAPAPTQLNRPALSDKDEEAARQEQSDADDPAPSAWSPLDSSRTQNPSRAFSTVPTPRPVSPEEVVREQRREPVADPLDLERLSQRAVVRHSESNQFSLDYEIEAIGGRGVEAIELYGTTDGGQTWKQWGSDPDKISPFDIETNGEGIFGFQIVVVAANGLASPRPLAGDAPDIVVVVDETEPVVGISGARYGESDRAGSLVIAYHCEDRYLTSRPITLSFSDSPSGPWTTIAAGLRNTGDYVWPADPQLPRQIYLRIDAIDQASNVGGYVLEEPIDTRGLAPRARIRAFRAIPSR